MEIMMIKTEEMIKEDLMKLCGWVEHSYHLKDGFFQNEFTKLIHNLLEDLKKANDEDEYKGILASTERTLMGLAQRHQQFYEKG